MTIPRVIIICDDGLVGPDADGGGAGADPPVRPTALSVSEALSATFGVTDTSVRPASVPVDRILSAARGMRDRDEPVVYAVLTGGGGSGGGGDSSSAAAAAAADALERECPSPVLRLAVSDGDTPGGCALAVARLCAPSSASVRAATSEFLSRRRGAALLMDAKIRTMSAPYARRIGGAYDRGAQVTGDGVAFEGVADPPERRRGKVRDRYDLGDRLALVTTDRQSGFDRMLAKVPYKGAVLNLISKFWFDRTEQFVPNHLLDVPHPNVSIVKKCEPFPIEFVVRAYMTGSTSTSIWKNYSDGVRDYCGHTLPEGMKKNQKLPKVMLTPTTKEEDHDRPISAAEIIQEGWMTVEDFTASARAALAVFDYGQRLAAERGLILVDTKYEFGKDSEGNILLIDEVNTPDSSRYWLSSSYEDRIEAGLEPENIDKEFLRLWFRDQCDPYNDAELPEAPRDLVVELSRRYISLYEMITWSEFEFDDNAEEKIADVIKAHLNP